MGASHSTRKLVEISTKTILLKLMEVVNCESMRNLNTNHLFCPFFEILTVHMASLSINRVLTGFADRRIY